MFAVHSNDTSTNRLCINTVVLYVNAVGRGGGGCTVSGRSFVFKFSVKTLVTKYTVKKVKPNFPMEVFSHTSWWRRMAITSSKTSIEMVGTAWLIRILKKRIRVQNTRGTRWEMDDENHLMGNPWKSNRCFDVAERKKTETWELIQLETNREHREYRNIGPIQLTYPKSNFLQNTDPLTNSIFLD